MKRQGPTQTDPVDHLEHTRLRLSFRATGAGLWDYDVDDDLLYCDDRWYEIVGVDRRINPIISIRAFQPLIHPEDVAAATAIDRRMIQELLDNDEGYRCDFRVVRPDGEVRWLRSVACIVRDEGNNHLRAIGCVTDISEFRDAAAEPPRVSAVTTQRLAKPRKPAPPEPLARRLTSKEKQCLAWVSVGKTAWETAVILGLSRRTVEFHLLNATRKLDAANKVQAAFIAVSENLLEDMSEAADR